MSQKQLKEKIKRILDYTVMTSTFFHGKIVRDTINNQVDQILETIKDIDHQEIKDTFGDIKENIVEILSEIKK